MTIYEHRLEGCAPVPLAGYLKALGVFRLIAEQADEDAQGWWENERFILLTTLNEEGLVRFFAEEYQPTPVIAPWNGGSGFWPKDKKGGIEAITQSKSDRFSAYRDAIAHCAKLIHDWKLIEAPKNEQKTTLLKELRASLSDEACRWMDGALALTSDGPKYPPILGTGGNDGRLDFSNNFMQRLSEVVLANGKECERVSELCHASIFASPEVQLGKAAIGQFSPGTAGGANATVGFEAGSRVNPWDFILIVEGALVLASAAVRRHATDRSSAMAFPFTTRATGAGSGAAGLDDESDARAEFWAPVWGQRASYGEIAALLAEGRAVVGNRAAEDGLDFARAASQLGINRGIASFQRFGFLMRAGKAYYATPIGRIPVSGKPKSDLIRSLDGGRWLTRLRRVLRSKESPASLHQLARQMDEALFRLAADGGPEAVQRVLRMLGRFTLEAARRPKLRETVSPPPSLNSDWLFQARDGSEEFAIATSVAGLDAHSVDQQYRLPFRRHLAPLDAENKWAKGTEAESLVVWSGRNLAHDLAAVLERRLIEAQRHEFVRREEGEKAIQELPLRSTRPAPLKAIAAFLADETDDERIAELAAGLAWVRMKPYEQTSESPLPMAYALLKPLFHASGVGPEGQRKIINPLPLLNMIRAGNVPQAVKRAQALVRGAGLEAPFANQKIATPVDKDRLAAALLVPISDSACTRLIERVYEFPEEENDVA